MNEERASLINFARVMLGHTSETVTRRHYLRHPQKVQPARKICPKNEFMPKTGGGENG